MDGFVNFADGTLSAGIASGDTSLTLQSGDGARFAAAPFNAVIYNSTDYTRPSDDPSREIVRVTAISTDTFTISRGQEGTSAANHNTSGKVYKLVAGMTAELFRRGAQAFDDYYDASLFHPDTAGITWTVPGTPANDSTYLRYRRDGDVCIIQFAMNDGASVLSGGGDWALHIDLPAGLKASAWSYAVLQRGDGVTFYNDGWVYIQTNDTQLTLTRAFGTVPWDDGQIYCFGSLEFPVADV